MLTSFLRKLSNWLRRNLSDLTLALVILGVGIFVSFQNFTLGTWLLGWDNLLPELNFKLNIARSFSAVWQEYQGLGLLGGMAHAADLPRMIFLWISSLAIPTLYLRYFWTFLMLTIGPLGVYMAVSRVLVKNGGLLGKIAGFTSAIFYLFNLATLQTFYTPFETFVSFYGFFPWLLYLALDFLKDGGRKKLLAYFLVSFFAASAFYVQTLFLVYAIFLVIFALNSIVSDGKKGILRSIKIGFVTLFANAFWLIPVLYFGLTSSAIPANSRINLIATPETQLMNMARANLNDIATLKGYWFDYYDLGSDQKYDYLYKTWIDYTDSFAITNVSLGLFLVSMVGLTLSLLKKKTPYGISLLILFGISYFMLNGGQISKIPFFSEIFRNAFTKWANAMAFIYAVGLGIFVYLVSDIIRNKIKYIVGIFIALFIAGCSVLTVSPMIKGDLVSKSMKVGLPSYYLDTIEYFKTQDSTKRIAGFPITDFWGWEFNDWGYRGSGLLWYGIPQPILDRAFDVWSPNNEVFYDEVSFALNANDIDAFKYVLNKYQIEYILFDGSVIEPGNSDSATLLQKEKDFLDTSGTVVKAKEFGKITIYEVAPTQSDLFVSAPREDYSLPYVTTGQTGDIAISETFANDQGYEEARNCDLKNKGSVVKERNNGNYYAAYDGGSSCDFFYYPNLDYSKGYILRIRGQNISGRSLKIYIYNVARKDVERIELLPSGDFDKSFIIYPTRKEESIGEGYTLNVETRSFGKIKSENTITAIKFYPVEISYADGPKSIGNNVTIKNIRKYGTWLYKIERQGSGLIQLGQGFEKGWIGLWSKDSEFKVLEHKEVNSWANGWVVPEFAEQDSTLYIFYWPQLLEWGGIILGIVLTYIIFRLY